MDTRACAMDNAVRCFPRMFPRLQRPSHSLTGQALEVALGSREAGHTSEGARAEQRGAGSCEEKAGTTRC